MFHKVSLLEDDMNICGSLLSIITLASLVASLVPDTCNIYLGFKVPIPTLVPTASGKIAVVPEPQ